MFLKNSRYAGIKTVAATALNGREVRAVKLRVLPDMQGEPHTVKSGDQLDVMSCNRFRDGTRFWHIADANTELEANELIRKIGRTILVPKS